MAVGQKRHNSESDSGLVERLRSPTKSEKTADEVGLKSDAEFRSAFVGYIEWGTRLAVINSQLTENPLDSNEPMPKWGWGETGGPYEPS